MLDSESGQSSSSAHRQPSVARELEHARCTEATLTVQASSKGPCTSQPELELETKDVWVMRLVPTSRKAMLSRAKVNLDQNGSLLHSDASSVVQKYGEELIQQLAAPSLQFPPLEPY
ncbi:unnamed protein product [Lota lota]